MQTLHPERSYLNQVALGPHQRHQAVGSSQPLHRGTTLKHTTHRSTLNQLLMGPVSSLGIQVKEAATGDLHVVIT